MAYLIGTAGHVDHGKTTLISALTGIDADRLPEEKSRGMTIDLGFAFVELDGIGKVSIVDVPGHERFVKNMLAGASGVDVALLCVAADEGVMPQTREHFQILRLLEARIMVVALTKVDAVDEETAAVAELDIASLLEESPYADAPILHVSGRTGEGIDELKEALRKAIAGLGPREVTGAWFLPIDRVFTVEGHGTVVTGTLAAGSVTEGSEAVLMPGEHRARIRSIEAHGSKSATAEAGMRTALNVTGVRKEALHRGQALGSAGSLFETNCLNVRLAAVGDLEHGSRVRVHIGTGEFIGRLFLFDHAPGFGQLRLEETAACSRGQRVVIRNYSPPTILAGGEIVAPNAKPRRKNDPAVSEMFSNMAAEGDRILELLARLPLGATTDSLCEALGETPQTLGDAFEKHKLSGAALGFAGRWLASEHLDAVADRVRSAMSALHKQQPHSASVSRSQVLAESGIGWTAKSFDRLLSRLVEDGLVAVRGNSLSHPDHRVSLNDKQSALLERVISAMTKAGATAPNVSNLAASVGAPIQAIDEMIRLGTETGRLTKVDDNIYYPNAVLEAMKETLRSLGSSFTVAQFRDATNSSRKYALPLLQHFDETRFTKRVGDERIVIG